ncbi:MAG: DegQ family serine endoprotease [Deltaproteobacteria bacterium]|nr:DegQ family serine endoprotease [Deltaproteobacteria bacterium]
MLGKNDSKAPRRAGTLFAASALAAVVGFGASELAQHAYSRGNLAQAGAATDEGRVSQSLPNFASLAKKTGPAVVNISTVQVRDTAQRRGRSPFGDDDRANEFFERFFGGQAPRAPQQRRGQGSGFIVDRNGTIVTNNHVIDGANKITVKLSDGRSFEGKVVGKDPKTDLAVIKIDAPQDLTAVSLGDSDRLEVGEWVMAIGNPFGLDHTVTSGIVSAKGRHIGSGPYEDYIQTDASINPGNSGGPLLNLRGEVIGINTAIFSQSGGNIGIGFAIPSNLVKELLPQLQASGKVVRGYIGATIQKMTPDLAESMGLKQAQGALVAEVAKDSPAERAGLKSGDVILQFDGRVIKDSSDLPLQVARVAPGSNVQVKISRGGKDVSLPLTVGELKDKEVVASVEKSSLGLTVQPATPELAEQLGMARAEGVVITSVEPGSAAEEAGMRRGDVISEIAKRPVRSMADYKAAIEKNENSRSLLFLVKRGETNLFLALKR